MLLMLLRGLLSFIAGEGTWIRRTLLWSMYRLSGWNIGASPRACQVCRTYSGLIT